MSQVAEHTESQRRQYGLADSARPLGFTSVTLIDDDLGSICLRIDRSAGFPETGRRRLLGPYPALCSALRRLASLETGATGTT
jgi:hypothetical protein